MQPEFQDLLHKLLNGELDENDRHKLLVMLDNSDQSAVLADLLDQQLSSRTFALTSELPETEKRFISAVLNKSGINSNTGKVIPAHRVHFMRRWGWAAAAALLLLSAGSYFLLINKKTEQPVVTTNKENKTILPGKSGAILTLADGSKLVLDSMNNGVIADQNGAEAVLHNGQLSYDAKESSNGNISYNTMSTPRGRQFRVTLPDGTGVWLNAASSIRYPTTFSGKDRLVHITGEAYFEVAKDEQKPFRVNLNNRGVVEVLGTEFNVNAYENESIITATLVSGAVRVNDTQLKPSQQAQLSNSPHITGASIVNVINLTDLGKVLAWKKGLFDFDGVSIQDAMKQLERWYDIEVIYEKGIPDIRFGGKMSKDMTLNGMLMALEKSEVKYRLEGNKLIVTK